MFPLKKILCPTDFSEPSLEALARATEFAAHFKAQLTVLNVTFTLAEEMERGRIVGSEFDNQELALNHSRVCELIALKTPSSVDAVPLVKLGDPGDEIIRAAKEGHFDLIIIATHGLTGWRHLVFGSVAEHVLRLATCPVLVVHGPEAAEGDASDSAQSNEA